MNKKLQTKLRYLMSTFIPLKQIVVVTRMYSDGTGKTDILKATEEGVPVRGEESLKSVEHEKIPEIDDLKRVHGKMVLHFFSPEFFEKINEDRNRSEEEVFFKLQILIKQFGLFFSVTKKYNKEYATARFFTEDFTFGNPDAKVTDIKQLQAEDYSEILRESFNLLSMIITTIDSVKTKILPIKEEILAKMETTMEGEFKKFEEKMENTIKDLKSKIIEEFVAS